MAARCRINITDEASIDLRQIYDYIQENSPQNAAMVAERILHAIDQLYEMPSRFKVVGKSRRTGSSVHAVVVNPFIVYYRVEESRNTVFVLTIRHGARRRPRRFD